MGLLSLLGAAFYYHPLLTATVIGVIATSIYIIRNTGRPTLASACYDHEKAPSS
jgi:hypothetical protein